jgi:GMP synthase (glutamine-hydrolysing)
LRTASLIDDAGMPRALIIQHLVCENPGRLTDLLIQRGYTIEVCHAYNNDPIPRQLSHDLLVVMGGSMGVADIGQPAYPFLAQEVTLIKSVIAASQPMLGICLGAQLLAHAAGARVYPNTINGKAVREVGWADVNFLGHDERPELRGLPAHHTMLHWHGDTYDLPSGAVLLASTPLCKNQLFRLNRQVGLQFHPEVTADMVLSWADLDRDFAVAANGEHGPTLIKADTKQYFSAFEKIGDRLLNNLLTVIERT